MAEEKKVLKLDDIEGDYATKKEIASILRISIRTVERLIEDGELPATKISPRNTIIAKEAFKKYLMNKSNINKKK